MDRGRGARESGNGASSSARINTSRLSEPCVESSPQADKDFACFLPPAVRASQGCGAPQDDRLLAPRPVLGL